MILQPSIKISAFYLSCDYHKLYAADATLLDHKNHHKHKAEKAMERYVISKADLIGLYQR